MEETQTE